MSRLTVQSPETLSMHTRDGVRLDADVYRPVGKGPYPVLLMRQAYGRRIACAICYAHPAWYASQGYIVVVQDIRGRGTSEGEFLIGEHDAQDGADAVDWAAGLPGSNGRVGMYGFSYQGYNQLMAASAAGPALRAIAPAMTPWDSREGWAWKQGALRLQSTLGWATQLASETARRRGDAQAYAELMAAARALPLNEAVTAWPRYMRQHADLTHYARWLETPADDPYWQRISAAAHAAEIAARRIPTFFIGGWHDPYNETVLQAYRDLSALGAGPMRMDIGPWAHFPWARKTAGVDYGPDAETDIDARQVRWFDRWLKDIDNGIDVEPPIRSFDLGRKCWRVFDRWPDHVSRWALAGNGLAALRVGDGRLLPDGEPWPETPGHDSVVNDPWRPAPSAGGPYGTPPGPVDRQAVDQRPDVMTFDSAPLDAPLDVAGKVSAVLYLSCDQADFDVSCSLNRIQPDGRSQVIADGYARVREWRPDAPVNVAMHAACVTLQKGESLRVAVAASAYPAYAVNPGTDADPASVPAVRMPITTLSVHYGPGRQSEVRLMLGTPLDARSAP